MKLPEAAEPTPQRAQSWRRRQWLTGGGNGHWQQQGPAREWQSAHCCPVSCKKQKLRVGAKQWPSTQEQGRADTGARASTSRGLSGPLMATPYSLIHENLHHWFHRSVFTRARLFFPPGRRALCHSPLLACFQSQAWDRSHWHLKAMGPTASGQEFNPFPKQQPLLTPLQTRSEPGGHNRVASSPQQSQALAIPEAFPHKGSSTQCRAQECHQTRGSCSRQG